MEIVLASASERRHELLKRITKDFKILISNFDESSIEFNGSVESYVETLAKSKALDVANKLNHESIVIGADTVVSLNKTILGKPKNEKEAFDMLLSLSGKVHKVYSGIAIVNTATLEVRTESVCTEVKFSKLNERDIYKYIATKEPMDKAGAYGIQGFGGVFVEKINGCYYNVVGLPLNRLKFILEEMGVNL